MSDRHERAYLMLRGFAAEPNRCRMSQDDAQAILAMTRKPGSPRIVCLCGSTRFHKEYIEANYTETMAGRIVLSVGFYPHSSEVHGEGVGATSEEKAKLDELHLAKIDLADEILVLNVVCRVCPKCGTVWRHDHVKILTCSCHQDISEVKPVGYIGDSTRREIGHALATGKPIRWLFPDHIPTHPTPCKADAIRKD